MPISADFVIKFGKFLFQRRALQKLISKNVNRFFVGQAVPEIYVKNVRLKNRGYVFFCYWLYANRQSLPRISVKCQSWTYWEELTRINENWKNRFKIWMLYSPVYLLLRFIYHSLLWNKEIDLVNSKIESAQFVWYNFYAIA